MRSNFKLLRTIYLYLALATGVNCFITPHKTTNLCIKLLNQSIMKAKSKKTIMWKLHSASEELSRGVKDIRTWDIIRYLPVPLFHPHFPEYMWVQVATTILCYYFHWGSRCVTFPPGFTSYKGPFSPRSPESMWSATPHTVKSRCSGQRNVYICCWKEVWKKTYQILGFNANLSEINAIV